ncbi:MAG: hypothetical protein JHC53_06050, partial [Thermoleophilia bacterium]|nr:hypothetical protein [Thermoleophilia bacterium]
MSNLRSAGKALERLGVARGAISSFYV